MALLQRLSLLFEGLDVPTGPARIVPKAATVFVQARPMDAGFARALLTPQHIGATWQSPSAFWSDLERRCAGVTATQLMGRYDWSLLHFQRDGMPTDLPSLTACKAVEIGFEAGRG